MARPGADQDGGRDLVEAEPLAERQRLPAHADRLPVLRRHHPRAAQLGQHLGHLRRRRQPGDQITDPVKTPAHQLAPALLLVQGDQQRLGDGGALPVARREQGRGGGEQLLLAAHLGEHQGSPLPQEQPRALGVVRWPQRQRLPVEAGGGGQRVEGGGAIAGIAQRQAGPLLELCRLAAGRPRQLERHEVVVRQQLDMVLTAPQRGDPLRGETVLHAPGPARDLRVGDVADKQVPERVFQFVSDR